MTLRPYVVTLALLALVLTGAMPSDAAGSGGGIYGDGVVQPWQWVWVPAAPPAPPPPR